MGSGSWPCVCECLCREKMHPAPGLHSWKPQLKWKNCDSTASAQLSESCQAAGLRGPSTAHCWDSGAKNTLARVILQNWTKALPLRKDECRHQHHRLWEFLLFFFFSSLLLWERQICQNTVSLNRVICCVESSGKWNAPNRCGKMSFHFNKRCKMLQNCFASECLPIPIFTLVSSVAKGYVYKGYFLKYCPITKLFPQRRPFRQTQSPRFC